jgi:hypothetical protein
MARTTKTPETTKSAEAAKPGTNPPVTFDLKDTTLQAIIAQAVSIALDKQKSELMEAAKSAAASGKSERSMANEVAVVRAFRKAGFGNVTPHVDVMTFNRWASKGFRPKEGTKSLKIKNLRLFHKSQVRPLTSEEKQAAKEQSEAAVARHTASVTRICAGQQ